MKFLPINVFFNFFHQFFLLPRQLSPCGDQIPASLSPPPRAGPALLTLLFPPLVPSPYQVLHAFIYSFLLLLLLSRFSRVRLCATPQTAAYQAPPSLGFSRQEHWSGLPFPFPIHESEKWKWSRSVLSASSRPHGLQPTRLLCPWDFPGKSTGVGCHYLLQYSFLVVRYSCLLSAGGLQALLCLKVYSWCIHGERCTLCPPTPPPSCSSPFHHFILVFSI